MESWLRREFEREQASGFALLRRVPDTSVVAFLDHFHNLNREEQSSLIDRLIQKSKYHFLERPAQSVYEQLSNALYETRRVGGIRYTGVNLLAGLKKDATHGGLENLFRKQGITGLALEPRLDLLPSPVDLIPVSIPSLRRLVKSALSKLYSPQITDIGSEIWQYEGVLDDCQIKLLIRYSARMGRPQLEYSAKLKSKWGEIVSPNLCFESVLGVGSGHWDYLTKENSERSIELLTELVRWMAQLPQRLSNAGMGESK